jgi:hypothetical protein
VLDPQVNPMFTGVEGIPGIQLVLVYVMIAFDEVQPAFVNQFELIEIATESPVIPLYVSE